MDGYALYKYLVSSIWFESAIVVVALVHQLRYLGPEAVAELLYLKGMPNVGVRHLGLLGLFRI